jgi:DNA-nicking Smr family endonuclease
MIWPQQNKTPKPGLPIQKPSGKNNSVDHAPDKHPAAKHYLNISSFTTNMTSRLSSNRELKPADLTAEKVSGISRTDAKRIRSGQVMPTARLDLHGMTKDNARIALRRFISDRQMEKHQHVLVITGKGTAGKGVIRQALPNWLDESPIIRTGGGVSYRKTKRRRLQAHGTSNCGRNHDTIRRKITRIA